MSGDAHDRVLGCLVGGMLGDAWGAPYEGMTSPVMASEWPAGSPTDDTALTLATCAAIVRTGTVEPAAIADGLLARFRRGGVRGWGASTLKALRDLDAGAHWALAGARGERAAGSGAAMRVAPLAFLLDPTSSADRRMIRDVARITHHHEEAYVGALAVVCAVRVVARGGRVSAASLVADVATTLPDSAVRDRLAAFAALDPETPPRELASRFGAGGFVAESVPLALFAAQAIAATSFASVIRAAILAGGDADTIASIAGQIAGCALGYEGLPQQALDCISGHVDLEEAERFARLVASREQAPLRVRSG